MCAVRQAGTAAGSVVETFLVALKLGLTSFGGPVAHLGYFERVYVRERGWISHAELSELIALCQLLPGPTSSQVGFLIGRQQAGMRGALAAWLGFTLPSALLMLACAQLARVADIARMAPALPGLQWVTVMVVSQAVWQMARNLCPDLPRAAIGACAALLLWLRPALPPVLLLLVGALAGVLLLRHLPLAAVAASPGAAERARDLTTSIAAVTVFLILLALSLQAGPHPLHSLSGLAALMFHAGALVFGGGHVVLPLLRDALVPDGWIGSDLFLAGYGAAQALPGPLFAFGAFIGASAAPASAAPLWAFTALLGLFLPGLLLALAAHTLWSRMGSSRSIRTAIAGISAAVVGLLAAVLLQTARGVFHDAFAVLVVLAGVLALQRWRVPPIAIVLISVALALLHTRL